MAYQALYRKWRPKTFDDVVGQSHVVTTLKNEISQGKTAHAYLFCGTRGTGKTSCAKIFARAINCQNPVNGNPCNECEICRGAMDGSILDITEIDAASNNGVDNIRQIKEEVMYSAVHAKYKIYIIDEVHMLSEGAFNALLKTLEEPPPYVVFILATTEAHSVPQTISSRCQRFDFKRILTKDIVTRLREICANEKINADIKAIELIARLADGALRDALSILDQCVSALPDKIDLESANEVLGIVSDDTLNDIVVSISGYDSARALGVVKTVVDGGRDINNFVDMLIKRFRDILVMKVAPDDKNELFSYGEDTTLTIKKQSALFDIETVSYILNVLCDAQNKAKYSKSPKIIYEISLVKLCNRQLDNSSEALIERIKRLENIIQSGQVSTEKVAKQEIVVKEEAKQEPLKEKKPSEPEVKVNSQNDLKEEKKPSQFGTWADVLNLLKSVSPPLHGALICKKAKISNGYIYFVNDGYTKSVVSCMQKQFDEAAATILGAAPKIKYVNQNEFDSVEESLPPVAEELKKRAESVLSEVRAEEAYEDDGFVENDEPPSEIEDSDPLDGLASLDSENIHFVD